MTCRHAPLSRRTSIVMSSQSSAAASSSSWSSLHRGITASDSPLLGDCAVVLLTLRLSMGCSLRRTHTHPPHHRVSGTTVASGLGVGEMSASTSLCAPAASAEAPPDVPGRRPKMRLDSAMAWLNSLSSFLFCFAPFFPTAVGLGRAAVATGRSSSLGTDFGTE